MTAVDSISLRQQLGEISHQEVKELNRLSQDGVTFSRSRKEPALLIGWNMRSFYLYTLLGFSVALYGRFAKGYNNLWLIAGVLPGSTSMITTYYRQPSQSIDNAYRYLLEKRSVSAQGELLTHCFNSAFEGNKKEVEALGKALSRRGLTLYDAEAELVTRIVEGKF